MRAKNNIAGQINFYLSGMPDIGSARPYDFLCEMEEVENKLLSLKNHMLAQIDYGYAVLDNIHKLKESFAEDLIPQLEEEQESLREYYDGLVSWQADLKTTPEIFRPHDNLPNEIDISINVAKELFEQQEALRWAIMEHNVDYAPKGKPELLSSSDEINKFISSL